MVSSVLMSSQTPTDMHIGLKSHVKESFLVARARWPATILHGTRNMSFLSLSQVTHLYPTSSSDAFLLLVLDPLFWGETVHIARCTHLQRMCQLVFSATPFHRAVPPDAWKLLAGLLHALLRDVLSLQLWTRMYPSNICAPKQTALPPIPEINFPQTGKLRTEGLVLLCIKKRIS